MIVSCRELHDTSACMSYPREQQANPRFPSKACLIDESIRCKVCIYTGCNVNADIQLTHVCVYVCMHVCMHACMHAVHSEEHRAVSSRTCCACLISRSGTAVAGDRDRRRRAAQADLWATPRWPADAGQSPTKKRGLGFAKPSNRCAKLVPLYAGCLLWPSYIALVRSDVHMFDA